MPNREHGEFLPDRPVGHVLTAAEWNAVARKAHMVPEMRQGGSDETMLAGKEPMGPRAEWFYFEALESIPANSVFGVNDEETAYAGICKVSSSQHGGVSGDSASPFGVYTNGDIAIPAGSIGLCKAVGDWETVELTCEGSPIVGQPCGLKPNSYTLTASDHRFGFICLSSVSADGRLVHHFMKAGQPQSVFGKVSVEVPASTSTTAFEYGEVEVEVRKEGSETWEKILQLWGVGNMKFRIYNHVDLVFEVGTTIVANEVMGVGLVVVSGEGTSKVPGIWMCKTTGDGFDSAAATPLVDGVEWNYESNEYARFDVDVSTTTYVTILKTGWYEHYLSVGVNMATSTGSTCADLASNNATADIELWNPDADPDPAFEPIGGCAFMRQSVFRRCADEVDTFWARGSMGPLLFHTAGDKLQIKFEAGALAGGDTMLWAAAESNWNILFRGDEMDGKPT